jgi:broad specificity phosphatase PhoE
MKRATHTAEAIARVHSLSVQPLDGLLDIHFGEWQGLAPKEVAQRYPDLYRAWREAPHTVQFPDGETLEIVRARALAGLDEVVARHPGETVALVSHAVVNRVLLCAILGLANDHFWRIHQDTCAVNVFDVKENDFTILVLMNDTSHLQGLS